MTTSSSAASAAEELARERERVVQRLRAMALTAVPTERVHATAQRLADLAADAGHGPRRTVPVLAPYAAGDQVAVVVDEVLATAADLAADSANDSANDSVNDSAIDLLTRATAALAELRRDC